MSKTPTVAELNRAKEERLKLQKEIEQINREIEPIRAKKSRCDEAKENSKCKQTADQIINSVGYQEISKNLKEKEESLIKAIKKMTELEKSINKLEKDVKQEKDEKTAKKRIGQRQNINIGPGYAVMAFSTTTI